MFLSSKWFVVLVALGVCQSAAGVTVSVDQVALLPPNDPVNVFEAKVSGGFLIGSDTEYPEATGWADVDLGFDMSTGDPVLQTFAFRGGELMLSDVSFSLAFGAITATTQGLGGIPSTPSPPGLVNDGDVSAIDHLFTIDRGQIDAAGEIFDFSAEPLEALGDGIGFASLTEVLPPTGDTRHFNFRVEVPIEANEVYTVEGVPLIGSADIDLEVTGQIVAEKVIDVEVSDGDFNLDGASDCLDLALIYDRAAANNNHPTFDANGDGVVTSADATAWITARGVSAGDANLDGDVNEMDFAIIRENQFSESLDWCRGDLTGDGLVDGSDFNVWNNAVSTSAPSAVPEPSSVWSVWYAWLTLLVLRSNLRTRVMN